MGGVGIGVFPGFCDGFPGMVPGMGGALFVEARFRTRTFAGVGRGYRPALLRPVARCCGGVCLAHAFADVPGLAGLVPCGAAGRVSIIALFFAENTALLATTETTGVVISALLYCPTLIQSFYMPAWHGVTAASKNEVSWVDLEPLVILCLALVIWWRCTSDLLRSKLPRLALLHSTSRLQII